MSDDGRFLTLSPEEWTAVGLSLEVALKSILVSLPVAILVGWLLGRHRFMGKSVVDAFIHLPFVLPPVVTGYVLLLLFGVRGPIGAALHDWFGVRLAFTTAGAVLATAVMTFPLMVRAIRLSAGAVDRGLEDAARTLGAGPLDRFFTITLPLMVPGIAAAVMTAFAAALGEFGAVITFAASIPGETQTLPLAIYGALQVPGGEETATRLSLVSFILALVALFASERLALRAQRLQGAVAMLRIDIAKRLGAFTLAVAFETDARGAIVVFGPSGAGKSCLLSAIAGLIRPDRGRIELDGEVLFDASAGIHLPTEARRIGFVFQEARLFPHLNVRDNLDYGRKRRRDHAAAASFDDVVALLGIDALLDRRPHALSGGEKQRVAIGRALLSNPRLLLFDEPLASLDDPRKAEILPFLERLRDEIGIPMLYVTHAMEEVARIADHLVLLDGGKVAAAGAPGALFARLDLPLLVDRADVGAILIGRVAADDAARGVTHVAVGDAEILLSHIDRAIGMPVRLRVLARDVAIATQRPEGLSVQNVLRCRLTEISDRPNGRCLLRLDLGGAAILALLTADSVRRLALRPGQEVFALVKSVASSALI